MELSLLAQVAEQILVCASLLPRAQGINIFPVPFVAEQDIPTSTGAEEKPRKTSVDPGRNVVKPNEGEIAKDEVLKTI